MNRRKRKVIWGMVLLLLLMGVAQFSRAAPEEEKKAAKDVAQCSSYTMPIQIMTPGYGGSGIKRSATEISDSIPHFRAFVTAVTKHIEARLAKDQLCINSAKSMDDMIDAYSEKRSLLQFVHWPFAMSREFLVPVLPFVPPRPPDSCWLSSPWIDLTIDRGPVPQIRGVVRWNDRQLLADQAALAGARNVPPGVAMPLNSVEYVHFINEYVGSERNGKPTLKPIEERIPPDLLWLFNRSGGQPGMDGLRGPFAGNMSKAREKGAEGYTKLVIALIDRCFDSGGANLHYNTILDAADLIPLEQYKIDTLNR